jgi:CDP-glucose 4,6-dehydratase
MNPQFWQGKKVFITGHTGFKGSWLSLWLQSLGAQVTGFALAPPTNPSLFDVAHVEAGMVSIRGDVRDFDSLQNSILDAKPEIVFHMAAQALVRYSYDHPVETYSTNVMGTVHLLEAIRSTPSVKAVVNVTSDKCYENNEQVCGYSEENRMGGFDPYSSSKGCAELVTAAYRNSFFPPESYHLHGVALATSRAGNVIGGGDWAQSRLIPDLILAIVKGQPVKIRNPQSIRPWQHVLEPLSGYLLLAESLFVHGPIYAEGWNFGPNDDDAQSVSWLLHHWIQVWGKGASWTLDTDAHPHEAHSLKLDCAKAKTRLGWHPKWPLAVALDQVVAWQKQYEQGANMRDVTLSQIETYAHAT